ncbi:MAG: AAA family ATPase [Candidatus Limnocylindrus sp.]
MTNQAKELLAFVRALPQGYAYAPIYVKGATLPGGQLSEGKAPLGDAWHHFMGPADVALKIERQPDVFQAVGVYTGPRSKGLVILDVDYNLSKLLKKWGDSLEGAPVVRSTKANAAKYLFLVPEEHWANIKGFPLREGCLGYEVLWGRQGLLYGAYPGSRDGKAAAGFYGFEGDLEAIPVAPEWLIAEMRDAANKKGPEDKGIVKNRKALNFSDRTEDEVAEIAQDCLKVIPQLGAGSRDQWVQVGMAIHDALPNELGLTLWSAWSADDPEYANEWKDGNPCEAAWKSFKRGGGIRFNSLIWMADQQDPKRLRFSDASRDAVARAEEATVQKTRTVYNEYEEVLSKAKEIQELENPAEQNHRLHLLALESGYKDSAKIDSLLIADAEFRLNGDDMSGESLYTDTTDVEYLIPDLLPSPAVIMLHGEGGNGKSAFAATLARHVLRAEEFSVRGQMFPVNGGVPGKVLWLNGDQSAAQLKRTLKDADLTLDDLKGLKRSQGWELQWYGRFKRMVEKHRPNLVVIDSITGCSRGSAYSENQKEFASPVYWLALNNGTAFPACTILLLHHSNKNGGYRGTSSLKDATDETWSIAFSKTQAENRVITVEKSRAGRKGRQMLLRQTDDMDFVLRDIEPDQQDTPAGFEARILARLHTAGERWVPRTQLASDPAVGGSVKALKKRLERLVEHQLVEERVVEERKGSPRYEYRLKLKTSLSPTRGVVEKMATLEKPSPALDREGGAVCIAPPSNNFDEPRLEEKVEGGAIKEAPPSKSSGGQGSSRVAEISVTHIGGSTRSKTELAALMAQTSSYWDEPGQAPLERVSAAEVAEANISATNAILKGDSPGVVDVTAKTVQ